MEPRNPEPLSIPAAAEEVRDKAGATLYRCANTSGHEEAAAQAIAELLAYIDPQVVGQQWGLPVGPVKLPLLVLRPDLPEILR